MRGFWFLHSFGTTPVCRNHHGKQRTLISSRKISQRKTGHVPESIVLYLTDTRFLICLKKLPPRGSCECYTNNIVGASSMGCGCAWRLPRQIHSIQRKWIVCCPPLRACRPGVCLFRVERPENKGIDIFGLARSNRGGRFAAGIGPCGPGLFLRV